VLSDGTLRFAAIVAAFFQPVRPGTLLIEELEKGLHPTGLRLLVELLKSQAGNGISQVMATSHSPYAISGSRKTTTKPSSFAPKTRRPEQPLSRRFPKSRD
jgi:predicted ATPase